MPSPTNPFAALLASLPYSGWGNPNAQAWTHQALNAPFMAGWGGQPVATTVPTTTTPPSGGTGGGTGGFFTPAPTPTPGALPGAGEGSGWTMPGGAEGGLDWMDLFSGGATTGTGGLTGGSTGGGSSSGTNPFSGLSSTLGSIAARVPVMTILQGLGGQVPTSLTQALTNWIMNTRVQPPQTIEGATPTISGVPLAPSPGQWASNAIPYTTGVPTTDYGYGSDLTGSTAGGINIDGNYFPTGGFGNYGGTGGSSWLTGNNSSGMGTFGGGWGSGWNSFGGGLTGGFENTGSGDSFGGSGLTGGTGGGSGGGGGGGGGSHLWDWFLNIFKN